MRAIGITPTGKLLVESVRNRRGDALIPYRLTPAGERVCVMGELSEQVAAVPRTVLRGQGVGNQAVAVVVPAEGAVS